MMSTQYQENLSSDYNTVELPLFVGDQCSWISWVTLRLFLCFSLFCVHVRVGFEPQKLQNKQKKMSIKTSFYGILICVVNAKVL
jgi:hypothetical protein